MSDAIFFKGLALHAYHGVMQHEAKVGQTFHIDLAIELELGTASRTDKLKDTASSKPPPARLPMRYWRAVLKCTVYASRSTSRMRRSPRPSKMSE